MKKIYKFKLPTKVLKSFLSSLALSTIILSMVITLNACQKVDMNESISDSRFLIGTIISIQLFGTKDQQLLEDSFNIIEEVDNLMSLNIPTSDLVLLNESAGTGPHKVSEKTFLVIEKALEYAKLSNGKLDITLEPVISLWKIGTDEAKVPDLEVLKEKLKLVDYTKVKLDKTNLTVELEANMSIDLGAIGKGYSADLVAAYLKEKNITKAILNLGGNILIIGEKAEDVMFRVGLQNPFASRNEYFGVVEVSNKTVVTSGVYERNFVEDGVTYHHILDTLTGFPVNNEVASVSIIADTSIDADALSTVLFVLGVDDGIALCETLDGIECIFVKTNAEIIMSSGAKDITTITDETFINISE